MCFSNSRNYRLSAIAMGCLGWRRHRSEKHDRKFLGGPRCTPSSLPISEPATEPDVNLKRMIAQRFTQVQTRPQKEPDCAAARYDIEKPQLLPIFYRRPTCRASAPMKQIPEVNSPRPSGDIVGCHRGEYDNAPVIVERDPRKSSPSSSLDQLAESLMDRGSSLEVIPSHTSTQPSEISASHSIDLESVKSHAPAHLDPRSVLQK